MTEIEISPGMLALSNAQQIDLHALVRRAIFLAHQYTTKRLNKIRIQVGGTAGAMADYDTAKNEATICVFGRTLKKYGTSNERDAAIIYTISHELLETLYYKPGRAEKLLYNNAPSFMQVFSNSTMKTKLVPSKEKVVMHCRRAVQDISVDRNLVGSENGLIGFFIAHDPFYVTDREWIGELQPTVVLNDQLVFDENEYEVLSRIISVCRRARIARDTIEDTSGIASAYSQRFRVQYDNLINKKLRVRPIREASNDIIQEMGRENPSSKRLYSHCDTILSHLNSRDSKARDAA